MKAVILAGGEGSRLNPLTKRIPKPLLPLGATSAVELQLALLKQHGCEEIYLATRHLARYLEAFLGDGSRFGVCLHYFEESAPRGTCGPLAALAPHLDRPFIVINCDVITDADLTKMYAQAVASGCDLTVATAASDIEVRFGVVSTDGDGLLRELDEKPTLTVEVAAGIYVMRPTLLSRIPPSIRYDMDEMIASLLASGSPIGTFHIDSMWIEIGELPDLNRAEQLVLELSPPIPSRS